MFPIVALASTSAKYRELLSSRKSNHTDQYHVRNYATITAYIMNKIAITAMTSRKGNIIITKDGLAATGLVSSAVAKIDRCLDSSAA